MYFKPPAPSGLELVVADTHRFPNPDRVSGVISLVTRMAQVIVVIEILIAERNPQHSLTHQRHDLMLDQLERLHLDGETAPTFLIRRCLSASGGRSG
jgi:hypothetical protein